MTHLLFGVIFLAAIDNQELTGKYLRYEGAEYESSFIPCGSKEVWLLEGGPAFKNLVDGYSMTPKNQYDEVMVVVRLNVTRIDQNKHPQSHYSATATVSGVVSIGAGVTCMADS